MSENSLILCNKTKKRISFNDMTNISIKSEKITAFGDVFFVLDKIVSTICSYIFPLASS